MDEGLRAMRRKRTETKEEWEMIGVSLGDGRVMVAGMNSFCSQIKQIKLIAMNLIGQKLPKISKNNNEIIKSTIKDY